jgi:hypothetical protein
MPILIEVYRNICGVGGDPANSEIGRKTMALGSSSYKAPLACRISAVKIE